MENTDNSKLESFSTENASNSNEKPDSPTRSENSGKRQINNINRLSEKDLSLCGEESFKKKKINGEETINNEANVTDSPDPIETKASNGKGDAFPKIKPHFKNRNYRTRNQPDSGVDKETSDDIYDDVQDNQSNTESNPSRSNLGVPEPCSSNEAMEKETELLNKSIETNEWHSNDSLGGIDDSTKKSDDQISLSSTSSSSSSSDSSTSALEDSKYDLADSDTEDPPSVLLKQKPKHKWFLTPEIINRQIGCSNTKQGPELFQQRMYGSLHSVQRLELMYKLKYHSGCVNSLNFNSSGTLLASGSDDLQICLWDWPLGKLLTSFVTGHKSNVFQAKFLPLVGDTHMVTCARDGQIRLVELGSSGELRGSRKLAQHRGPAHKLATQNEMPHVFLSCGEDALVMSLDVRQSKPAKVLFVKEGAKKVSLYSVHSNPLNNRDFVVSGRDNYLRIYDQRNTSSPKSKFCPQHLIVKEPYPHVTCAVFNYNGTEIVASYNDEDIYLFDTRHSDGCDFVHRYQGHRNSATVKGVNFFGPKSEFIVSGSDCGNIFFWERETEAIVQWMAGDENGVVNCLEPHPEIPVLATSGLDEDVKIWVPSCEQEPTLEGLKKTVITNLKGRHADPSRSSDALDGQMLWILWRHIRRTDRRARQEREQARNRSGCGDSRDVNSSAESSPDSDNDEDLGTQGRRLQCSPS